jgi:hypothetical protein
MLECVSLVTPGDPRLSHILQKYFAPAIRGPSALARPSGLTSSLRSTAWSDQRRSSGFAFATDLWMAKGRNHIPLAVYSCLGMLSAWT